MEPAYAEVGIHCIQDHESSECDFTEAQMGKFFDRKYQGAGNNDRNSFGRKSHIVIH
jgi:hypothetical protein